MSKPPYHRDFKLGVLGGGQLGRMMQQEAVNLDIKLACLDPNADAPCAKIVPEFVVGSFNDEETVYNFGKDKDLITVEIEHVNTDALEELEQRGVAVYPQPHLLRMIQDKGLQKEFYQKNNIPSSAFQLIESKAEIEDANLKFPIFQKLRKSGYDGYGVQSLKDPHELSKAFDARWIDDADPQTMIVQRFCEGFAVDAGRFHTDMRILTCIALLKPGK